MRKVGRKIMRKIYELRVGWGMIGLDRSHTKLKTSYRARRSVWLQNKNVGHSAECPTNV